MRRRHFAFATEVKVQNGAEPAGPAVSVSPRDTSLWIQKYLEEIRTKSGQNQDGPAVAMQVFIARRKSIQRDGEHVVAGDGAFMLLIGHSKDPMSWTVWLWGSSSTLGINPSAEGPTGAEITSVERGGGFHF